MHENENILMSDELSVDEMSADEIPEVEQVSKEEPKPKRTRRKKTEEVSPDDSPSVQESDEETDSESEETAFDESDDGISLEDIPENPPEPVNAETVDELLSVNDEPAAEETVTVARMPSEKSAASPERTAPILTIEAGREAFTEEMQADIAWHEIHNAYRTWRILSGTFGGLEQLDNGKYVGIVEYKGYRILIPTKEMVYNYPNQLQGSEYKEAMQQIHRNLSNILGAQIDFIVKGIDSKARSVVASRKDAMRKKRQIFYIDEDLNGEHRVREGRLVQARIIGVHEKVLRLEIFGVETTILARNLSWEWIGDVHDHYSVGDHIVVRITKVEIEDIDNIRIGAAVRSDVNSARDNLKLCKIQGKYSGTVIDVHKGVCFIRLNNGVNAVAHSCRDRRYPGKKDDVSFTVTSIDEERGTAVGIITRIIKQNL